MKRAATLILAGYFLVLLQSNSEAKDPPLLKKKLDFAQGDALPKDASHDWNLGPIGARGWCHVSGGGSEGTTQDARQILLTKVDPIGAASKVLQQGDVILGCVEQPFRSDTRIVFAKAIGKAESSDGKLPLIVARDGVEKQVVVRLPKVPAFSASAPFDCTKSQRILREGTQALFRRGLGKPSIASHINALALLATGDPAYRAAIMRHAHQTISSPLATETKLPCWSFSFTNLFLCEYYLATSDKSVLQEISRLTGYLVDGQGPLGTWGHSFVDARSNRLQGYGAVNAVGLPAAISLVLASECGLEVEGLEASIALSAEFFRRHVGLGAIPYGDGPPNLQYGHDDNGKNAAAAIFFSLLNDETATRYYVRMALAAYGQDREQGHTGNFFNMLWSLPATSLAGPEASGKWMQEFGWYYDLARDAEYRFRYQGYPRQTTNNAYAKWDCPGAYLLHFAVPLKKLRITGRNASSLRFTSEEIEETIACGRIDYQRVAADYLQKSLSSWSPVVRHRSAAELRRRKIKPTPLARLDSTNPLDRIAALRASRNFTDNAKRLGDADLRVRIAALETLARLNRQQALAEVFSHLATKPDEQAVFTQAIGHTFFPISIRAKAVEKLLVAPQDRKVTVIAIRRLLNDEDALVASRIAMGLGALPENEILPLLPLVYDKAKHAPVGNVMFSDKLRVSCAEVLAKRRLQEGLEVSVALLTDPSWGKQSRLPRAASLVLGYQGHAKPAIPVMNAAIENLNTSGDAKWRKLLQETVAKIDAAPEPKGVLSSLE